MEYSHLGNSGLQVSRISYGNMVNHAPEDEETNIEIIKTLYEAGVNFFDSAEAYEKGKAEEQLGRSIKKLNLPRERLVITVKIASNEQPGGNQTNRVLTLNRKHIVEGVNESLKRMQLDYADIVIAHFYDNDTTIDEICRGFNQVIEDGKAFYWATSNWSASQIQSAFDYCDKHGLIKPIADQCIYNQLNRNFVEKEFISLFEKGYGTTTWSPLQGGLLTGKYNKQIPEGSRAVTNEFFKSFFFSDYFANPDTMKKLVQLEELAKSLGYTQTQLSIAWVLYNKNVSTAIIGARTVEQAKESLKALELYKKWDKNLEEKVESILKNKPSQELDFTTWLPLPDRRL